MRKKNQKPFCKPLLYRKDVQAIAVVLSATGLNFSSPSDCAWAATAAIQVMPADKLSGSYAAPTGYPRVFENKTQALAFLVAAKSDSGKAMALTRLTAATKTYIATAANYEIPYVGTDINAYLVDFSAGSTAAAPVAAELALYAYLTDLKAGYGDAATAASARLAAETIMLKWVMGSFQDANGKVITSYNQFTSSTSTNISGVWASVGLQIGRGMIYFTDALDLLNDGNAPAAFVSVANTFDNRMLNLEIGAANYHYTYNVTGCARFDNQASMQDLALAAMGRYMGRSDVINALAGTGFTTLLDWSFPQQIEGNIYGNNEAPRTCNPGTGAAAADFFQTAIVASGEIVDRFRAEPYQPFGYALGSLASLELTASILTKAGYKPAAYAGQMGQSLKAALDYYGWYVSNFLSYKAASIPSSGYNYPDFAQYAGDAFTLGSGASIQGKDAMLEPFMLGAQLYPTDTVVKSVLAQSQTLAVINGTYSNGAMDIIPLSSY